jgi:hypothetical protein
MASQSHRVFARSGFTRVHFTRLLFVFAFSAFALCGLSLSAERAAAAAVRAERDKTLHRCQSLDKKIERYTRLRRAGGNAAQMERWRDTRRQAQTEFQKLRCHKYGRRLRDRK